MTILLSNNQYIHLPFITHARACHMYVKITCMRLKCALRFVIVLIAKCTAGMMALWKHSEDELPDSRGHLANNIIPVLQSKPIKKFDETTTNCNMLQTKHQTHSNFRLFKFHVYLILYTRLLTKLNLFKILLYITLISMKVSRKLPLLNSLLL